MLPVFHLDPREITLEPQSPRFDLMIFRLRRARWAAQGSGNANATRASPLRSAIRLDAGTNASKNNVAGRSQRSMAALSIRTIPSVGIGAEKNARYCSCTPSGRIRGASENAKGTCVGSGLNRVSQPRPSITRFIAGCFLFFTFTQCFDLPP